MSAIKSGKLRGSQKLLNSIAKNGEAPSVEQIKRALSLPLSAEIRIPRWLIRGIPPHYLELDATIESPLDQLSDVIKSFTNLNDSAFHFRVFPNGIPVIDGVTILVSTEE